MLPLEPHPLADIFPLMSEDEYRRLKADIAQNGLRLPLTLYEGKILDGRNRYSVCVDLGIEPATSEFIGPGTAAEFVASMNLHRRHLNDAQRAMAAARLARLSRVGRPATKIVHRRTISVTQTDAAKLMSVSRGTVNAARKVLLDGTAEEIAAADAGQISVTVLAEEIKHGVPPEQRTKTNKRRNPARPTISRIGAAVLARVAEEEKAKQEKAAQRKPKPKLVTLHGERIVPPIQPAPSFSESIAGLIRMHEAGLSEYLAAEELRAKRISLSALDRVVLWLMEIEAELQRTDGDRK
jgi:hypothetical protein